MVEHTHDDFVRIAASLLANETLESSRGVSPRSPSAMTSRNSCLARSNLDQTSPFDQITDHQF